jgi:hypothetical protein
MEQALVLFLSQWHAFLRRYQIRNDFPSLPELLSEYDRCVRYVDAVHPGFLVYVSTIGSGLFDPVEVILPVPAAAVRRPWGGNVGVVDHVGLPGLPLGVIVPDRPDRLRFGDDMDDDEDELVNMNQPAGESSAETIRRIEEVIDLTLD